MSVPGIGGAPFPAPAAAGSAQSSEAQSPDTADDDGSDNGAASLPPVQAAKAPGTGQKVDVIA
jgi:hypothetical protein